MRTCLAGKILPILLALTLLPFAGLAVEENVVIPLPTVAAALPLPTADTASDYSVNRMAGYFASQDYPYQRPALTETEQARAAQLLKDYQNGKRPAQSVLSLTENVQVGVYGLRPEDYEGERAYVLLPCRELTDDELLAIIDAYAQLGLTLDPAGFSYRNCMRGGGIETTRVLTEEESDRLTLLHDLYNRQGMRPEKPYTPLPEDDGLGNILLDEESFSGLPDFRFVPYRRQTDEELMRCVSAQYVHEDTPASPTELSAYENQTRRELMRVLGAPLALERQAEGIFAASDFSIQFDNHSVYRISLTSYTFEGRFQEYVALLNVQTGMLDMVWADREDEALIHDDLRGDLYDPKWVELTREAIEDMRSDNVAIVSIEPTGGECGLANNAGLGIMMRAIMADGGYYEIVIAYQDEKPHMAIYQCNAPKPVDSIINH